MSRAAGAATIRSVFDRWDDSREPPARAGLGTTMAELRAFFRWLVTGGKLD